MTIHIWVENDGGLADASISFKGKYTDVLDAENGLRTLVERYMRVVPPTIDEEGDRTAKDYADQDAKVEESND